MSQADSAAQTRICLIVEDSFFDQEKLRNIMTRSFKNVRVEVAGTLAHARAFLQKYQVDIVLLDNNMPDGKGANLAVEMSKHPQLKHIPIILVSDWPSPFMFDKAQSAGVAHVVNKSDFGARFVHSAFVQKLETLKQRSGTAKVDARSA